MAYRIIVMIKKSVFLALMLSAFCSVGLGDDSPKGDGAPRKDVGAVSSPTTAVVASPVIATVFEVLKMHLGR